MSVSASPALATEVRPHHAATTPVSLHRCDHEGCNVKELEAEDFHECRCGKFWCQPYHRCPDCVRCLGESAHAPAMKAIRKYLRDTPELKHMDASRFIVEDECGGLQYAHGDLSALIGTSPAFDRITSRQMETAVMRRTYDSLHQEVWRGGHGKASGSFKIGSGWSCFILPLSYGEEEGDLHYTVSAFYKQPN